MTMSGRKASPNSGSRAVQRMKEMDQANLIHRGRWTNPNVYRFYRTGHWMVLKGFPSHPFFIRWTWGTFLTLKEISAWRRLSGISGVPEEVHRCSPFALCYRYMEGKTLGALRKTGQRLPKSYFINAEKLLFELHKREMVHLDLRQGSNWIVQPDGKPAIIDFQSSIPVGLFPRNVRKLLYSIDYSGLYKLWNRLCEEPLDPKRQAILDRINRMRKFWIFKTRFAGKPGKVIEYHEKYRKEPYGRYCLRSPAKTPDSATKIRETQLALPKKL